MKEQCKRTNENLRNLIGESWESLINQIRRSVLVRITPEALKNPTGQMITVFTLNMLIRLFPVVTDIFFESPPDTSIKGNIPKWQGNTIISKINAMYESVQPDANLFVNSGFRKNEICCHITIGSGTALNIPGVWVGSDRWIATLSAFSPQKLNPDINPVGAYIAATFAVSEAWKRIMIQLQERIETIRINLIEGEFKFSAFDYSLNVNGSNPALPETVNLNKFTMIGLGAGGGAAAYTLASVSCLKGVITLIDPDEVELSNLNRYPYADHADAKGKISKVRCIEKLFSRHVELKSKCFYEPYLTAQNSLEVQDLRRVISAVDNRQTRREIQYETPEIILDAAATEKGDFFIWRILLGQTECMICKHPTNEKDNEIKQAEQLSKAFGLEPITWLNKIANNDLFTEQEIKTIFIEADNSGQQINLPQPGQRFQEWFKKNCGRLELPEVDGEIPIPFAPVMAGILQAGELIKENLFPDSVLKSYYWNTLTAKFNPNIEPQIKRPIRDCSFCSDDVFIGQYKRRWVL